MHELYIGVMSGTSLDGVDIALCKIDKESCELLHSAEYPFDKSLKDEILTAINTNTTLKIIGEIDTRLGELYSECISAFINHFAIDIKDIKAIGLHGQTVWHEPNNIHPFSMQLGNANIVTKNIGISVVSDFRRKDIAYGGQGAPLTPAFHKEIFSKLGKNIAVVNIGGMSNITLLDDRLSGYDTGVGNALLDLWISNKRKLPYDKDGEWAKSGHVDADLLNSMLNEPYLFLNAPKSCGRELFNENWLHAHISKHPLVIAQDVQATLLEFTSITIANEVKKTNSELVILCGGGAKNSALVERLKIELKDINVEISDKYGISSDFLEAMAFAWLAYKRVHREKIDIKSVTGATDNSILGCIYE